MHKHDHHNYQIPCVCSKTRKGGLCDECAELLASKQQESNKTLESEDEQNELDS
jgi:hypothetical protein